MAVLLLIALANLVVQAVFFALLPAASLNDVFLFVEDVSISYDLNEGIGYYIKTINFIFLLSSWTVELYTVSTCLQNECHVRFTLFSTR
jgi:hypothetical protein